MSAILHACPWSSILFSFTKNYAIFIARKRRQSFNLFFRVVKITDPYVFRSKVINMFMPTSLLFEDGWQISINSSLISNQSFIIMQFKIALLLFLFSPRLLVTTGRSRHTKNIFSWFEMEFSCYNVNYSLWKFPGILIEYWQNIDQTLSFDSMINRRKKRIIAWSTRTGLMKQPVYIYQFRWRKNFSLHLNHRNVRDDSSLINRRGRYVLCLSFNLCNFS